MKQAKPILPAIIVAALLFTMIFTIVSGTATLQTNHSVVYYLKELNKNIIGGAETASIAVTQPVVSSPILSSNSILLPSTYLSATCIDKILAGKNSPAAGSGNAFVNSAEKYGINPSFVLAIFNAESNYATNPAATTARSTRNIGHILCTGAAEKSDPTKCLHKTIDGYEYYYKIYSTWNEGVEATFSHLKNGSSYIKAGRTTIESVSSMWVTGKNYSALSGTQKTEIDKYIATVKSSMDSYPKNC
ncbi:MAG: hypothetical protein AABW59_04145 [archaeon]|mgnify:CR=1 FL=1